MSSTVYCVIYSAYIGGQGHIFSRSKKISEGRGTFLADRKRQQSTIYGCKLLGSGSKKKW